MSIYGGRDKKVNHRLDSLPLSRKGRCQGRTVVKEGPLSRKDRVSVGRLRSGHHPDLKNPLHKIGRALDTVCQKYGMGRRLLNTQWGSVLGPTTQLPEHYLIATNLLKALELWELWKAKHDLPGIPQPGQLT